MDTLQQSIKSWTTVHTFLMLFSWGIAMYMKSVGVLFLGALISFLYLFGKNSEKVFTWANAITSLRFILIGIALGMTNTFSSVELFGLLTTAVLLDIVDGYVARKFDQTSVLGLHYDMEVDAFFVLSMGVYFFFYQEVPFWILVPGLLRYLYTTMMAVWPKQKFVETKQKYASTIAGIFFAVLLAGILLSGTTQQIVLAIGSALIMFSFGKSFYDYLTFTNAAT